MKSIYLVGFMGSGKTEVGRALAELLTSDFVDLDETIEHSEGASVREIFAKDGEERFRALEREAVAAASRGTGKVVSCGGGVVLDPENVRRFKEAGWVVLLTADPHVLYERVKDEGTRPLLDGTAGDALQGEEGREQRFLALLRERAPFYERAADHTVDTGMKSPREVAEAIARWLKETGRLD